MIETTCEILMEQGHVEPTVKFPSILVMWKAISEYRKEHGHLPEKIVAKITGRISLFGIPIEWRTE